MPESQDDIHPDLLEAIDSLLEDIEETTQSFTPDPEKGFDPNALVTDQGTIEPEPIDKAPTQQPEETAPIDSIENAQQALDALDEVENQAEELVAQSIDALLDQAQEISESELDPEPEPESEPEPEPESALQTEPPEPDIDSDDLLASIDDLLQNSENTDQQEDSQPQDTASTPDNTTAEPADEISDEIAEEASIEKTETTDEILEINETDETDKTAQAIVPDPDPVVDTSEEPPLSQTPPTDELGDSMDMLDSALSEAADDMLDGDFETEEGELVTGEAVASAIEKALEAQPKPGDDSDDIEDLLADVGEDLLEDSDSTTPPIAESAPDTDIETDTETAEVQATQTSTDPEPTPTAPTDQAAPTTPAAPVPENTSTADPKPEQKPEQKAEQKQPPTPKPEPAAQALDPDVQSEIEALEETQVKEPTPIPAWFERTIEIVRPKIDKIDPLKGKTMDALAMGLGTIIVTAMTHATPIAARLMILVSKPLAKYSPEVRNAIGYIALWTGFLAVALWLYLLMFRAPTIPHPQTAPTRVINADESLIVQPVISVLP